ncbi:MAG: hypothetical protein L3J28_01305 [Candidatus Polarisedimenticolaceae bacterium]|nr:hypothetical protein [Candidatus Polarisedimenticolaceae bacterium]
MRVTKNDYPELADLMSGWFHQDFDIEGETVPEIISAFIASSSANQCESIMSEILSFIQEHNENLSEYFIQIFEPDIELTEFAETTKAFLEEIYNCLNEARKQ